MYSAESLRGWELTRTIQPWRYPRLVKLTVLAAVVVLVVAGALWWLFLRDGDKRVTAYFSRTVGVYEESDVRALGVKIGEIESLTPQGEQVEVAFRLDADAPVASDTNAVVVSPSLVADRYVQLTELGGEDDRIPSGTTIPVENTATPVEVDELYDSLDDLADTLGPEGANTDGALSDLLDTGKENLQGTGRAFNDAIRDFADMARTLEGSEEDLFGTVEELQVFTEMLAENDEQVSELNEKLATVSQTLSDDREELSAALQTLGVALADVQSFIEDNREGLKTNVDKLADTTQIVVDRRSELAEALDTVPLAADNVLEAFDSDSGTLQGRTDILEYFLDPEQSGGGAASGAGPPLPLPDLDEENNTASEGGS